MADHFPDRNSKTPGPRARVTLDVAEASLQDLRDGIEAVRVWLIDRGDNVYTFHATQTLGTSRKQAGEPAVDIMRRLVNDFADSLDGDDVPQRLRDRWDALVEEYVRLTAHPERRESIKETG